ncbi:MAG: hypothetical protein J6M44_15290, partial [Butyrivibrio sp.]|nr:hypothetical protein [Butyrivibrio sp.]
MTSSTSRTLRKAGAVALSLALAMSTLAVTPAEAAAKVKLAKTKITVKVGKTKKVKVKGVKAKQVKKITVKSSKKAVAVAKKVSKVKIKVTGKKKGTATVKVNLKLKKKVGGKKKYNLKLAVTVKKAAATPTEAPVVTPVPTQAPVVSGQGITLLQKTATVATGASIVLQADLTPADSNDVVTWTVSNPAFAKVEPASDASGSAATLVASGAAAAINGKAYAKVTGIAEGSTQITAKVGDFSAVCQLTVIKNTIVAKLTDVIQRKANAVDL